VLGEAVYRFAHVGPWQDAVVKRGYSQAFAPDFNVPDFVVDDYDAMTYTSYDQAAAANEDFLDEEPLTDRLTSAGVPAAVVVGSEDQTMDDPREVIAAYEEAGFETTEIEGAGHSPNVEKPEETAEVVLEIAERAAVIAEEEPRDGKGKRRGGKSG
jgi:pimeloyl-ACP methyl ester carboxylesterase